MAHAIPIAVLLQIRSDIDRQSKLWSAQHPKGPPAHSRHEGRYGRSERNASHRDVRNMEAFLKELEAFRLSIPGVTIPQEDHRAREVEFLDRLRRLHKCASSPSPLGRVVSWPVAGGHAFYFVKTVRGPICQLVHIPIGDAYHAEAVCEGMALTRAVEKRLLEQAVLASHPQYSRWALGTASVLR
ncbi:MAG: hypothetical protein AB9869_15045 [Verrucomicrobiia bacterium]